MSTADEIQNGKFDEMAEEVRCEMEKLATNLKDLILSQPPEALLGRLWGELLLGNLRDSDPDGSPDGEFGDYREALFFGL